jgi:sirohydrochlorin cobaltochelatase
MAQGILLLAHGSRDPAWRAPIEAVAARIQALAPGTPVRCAYIELSTPTLPEAAAELVAAGCTALRVVPLFLGMGKHTREDMPRLVQRAREQHPAVAFTLAAAVGEHAALVDLLARIALEMLSIDQ